MPESGSIDVSLTAPTKIYVHDTTKCCQYDDHVLEPGKERSFQINALPGHLIPLCPGHEGAFVNVDGGIAHNGEKYNVTFGSSAVRTHKSKVEFVDAALDKTPIEVSVEPAKDVEVKCVVR